MLSPDQQQELLDNVVEDFTMRLRNGERPAIAEYTDKYPSISEDIEELLTSVAMIEELKTQQQPSQTTLKREMKEILKLDRIGDYRIIRELGRGGMGIVFEAVHESLGRRVAIKVMPNRTFDDQKYLERFRREAQAAASLHHTNIVSVFGIGQTGEHHYYVMEFVDGEPLSGILSRLNELNESITRDENSIETLVEANRGIDKSDGFGAVGQIETTVKPTIQLFDSSRERVRWAAQLGAQIADGLSYAHILGMLHRDIKPSNLLVDKNETIWLTDFGLVKNISNQTITKTGDIIGTPQYMAPESFEGQYDQRSETYCLGLTLYEMATLKPAFENASTPELIRRITTTTPTAPRKLDPRIPRDLERIIQKAISKEPSYRYQSAAGLREDLRAFLDDRPISARKISMGENIWRWSRRNPFSAAMSILTGLMICLIAITATIALAQNNRALVESLENKKKLEVEFRRADFTRRQAERTTRFTVESYDRMFRAKILDDGELEDDVALDGFMNLEGISGSIDESDVIFLEKMLKFYEEFADKHTGDFELVELKANSLRRVANIYHLIGQFEPAIEWYEKAIEVYLSIQRTNIKSIPAALNLVRTINEKCRALELHLLPKQRSQVEVEYDKAIAVLREHPSINDVFDLRLQIELAKTLLMKSFPSMNLPNRIPERFAELRKESLAFQFGGYDRDLLRLLRSHRGRGTGRNRSGGLSKQDEERLAQRRKSSEDAIKECLEIADTLIQRKSQNNDVKFVKAITLTRWSMILRATGRPQLAAKTLKDSTDILVALHEAEPEKAEYEFALAQNCSIPQRRRNVEIDSLNKAKSIMLSLTERFDRNVEYQRFLGQVCIRLGSLYKDDGKLEQAENNFTLANSIYRPLLEITPRNLSIQSAGFKGLLTYVDHLIDVRKSDLAIETLNESIDDLEIHRDKLGFRMIQQLYVSKKIGLHSALAIVYKEAGDYDAAIKAKQDALYLLEHAPGRKRMRDVSAPKNRR